MESTTRRLVAGIAIVVATLGGSVGTAAAATVSITLPCGCNWSVTNNGKAADTPAADNPTGTVGNADNDNRVYNVCQTCEHYPSAVVDFAP